ncbi:aminomethyl-transferring glycine dehydrogenase subunit GcvPA [candidate division WOR-3 bacterium]|uniref:Probable glycine dehydrogenase (decarboxylating) subunit 1 n=1 Tax=candidate division WOR-3 bacterium TaxID=2052148 RepID=A0A9D5K874_UNCW3|nr:aminomethyl-transferring glycine dehydrogenase subunit GcvPA [candidate division WOR-3 bacterium]MBD3364218.1 aminomethyl-transferring glycine dehydrogenase subunit GcvPA [candidate division WOR-3 bacterium]
MASYISNTPEDIKRMLAAIGVEVFEDLLADIPENLRIKGELNLPPALAEYEVKGLLGTIAGCNCNPNKLTSFMGGGVYDHISPALVDYVISKPQFYTAYTPYQPEVSQATLASIYEYQSLICELFDMDVSNASVYDGGSALAEAVHMARALTFRKRVLVADTLNPYYIQIIKTYCEGLKIPVEIIPSSHGVIDPSKVDEMLDDDVAAIVAAHPNFFGLLESVFELSDKVHNYGGFFICQVDPISLGILEPPGAYEADIAVAEGQSLGLPQEFGGPYLGIFTSRKDYIRRMPGRIIGKTRDSEGNPGFVMTLQTREQHIRREKATSNICTNQGLCALAAAVFLAVVGKEGIKEMANQCVQKAHYLAERLEKLGGCQQEFRGAFFKEFVVRTHRPAAEIVDGMLEKGFLAGVDLGRFRSEWSHLMLVAVTEKRTKQEIDDYIDALATLR